MSRKLDSIEIKRAYKHVEDSLRVVGKLLRTTDAGKYMWAGDHRSAVTGLRVMVEILRRDVQFYGNDASPE